MEKAEKILFIAKYLFLAVAKHLSKKSGSDNHREFNKNDHPEIIQHNKCNLLTIHHTFTFFKSIHLWQCAILFKKFKFHCFCTMNKKNS